MKIPPVPKVEWAVKVKKEELENYLKNNEEMPTYLKDENHIICKSTMFFPQFDEPFNLCAECLRRDSPDEPLGTWHMVLKYHEFKETIIRVMEAWCCECSSSTYSIFGPRVRHGAITSGCPVCPARRLTRYYD